MHAKLKRSDPLLPGAQRLERLCPTSPIAVGTWYSTTVAIQTNPRARRGAMAPQSGPQLPPPLVTTRDGRSTAEKDSLLPPSLPRC
jgi:hypothetical protein